MMSATGVGLIGFGTVGAGFVEVLRRNAGSLRQRNGFELELVRVADLDVETDRGVSLPPGTALTTDAMEVIRDERVGVVVELIGGIEPARDFLLEAIRRGKHVVTANKALLAEHGDEIFDAAASAGVEVAFEASVGGGIPVIRAIRESLSVDRITAVYGIINGTSNYILTKMAHEGKPFEEALAEAQEAGYAEKINPSLDVEGLDTAHKLVILARLAFGVRVGMGDVCVEGITGVTPQDLASAAEFGYRVKLLGVAKEIDGAVALHVGPTLVREDRLIAFVEGVNNAICIHGEAGGETMLYGQGAGRLPTGVAVLGDVVELLERVRSGAPARRAVVYLDPPKHILPMDQLLTRYYLRFSTVDVPGVLAQIAGILGANNISISSVIQKEHAERTDVVSIIMMTHRAREADMRRALAEVDRLEVVKAPTFFMRVED